jgi:hypothetical protein
MSSKIALCPSLAKYLRISGEFAEVFNRITRIDDPVDVKKDAIGAAEEIPGVFGEGKRGTNFGNDFADGIEVDRFRLQQLSYDLSVLIGIAHVMLLLICADR